MPYDPDDEESEETGGQLRAKLEDALKRESRLTEQLSGYVASSLIVDKGLTLVKPEDLKGVELKDLEAKAVALQGERQTLQTDLLRDAFKRQGYEEDAIERMVAGSNEAAAHALSSNRALGKLDGTPVPLVDPRNLSPVEKMEYALKAKARKKA